MSGFFVANLWKPILESFGAVRKYILFPTLLLHGAMYMSICSDVHRARQNCFGLLDLIRYSQNPGEDLSTQVVETTLSMSFSTTSPTWIYRPKANFILVVSDKIH